MTETLYVRHGRLHYFIRETLKRLRLPAPHASKVGDILVAADLGGVEGDGVARLPAFASSISAGLINRNADVQVSHQEEATATINGDNGMGHVVANRSMELAISLAKTYGVSAVAAQNSNDFGMAGYYARMALEEQMLAIVVSNATPAMLPTYGTVPMVGSNPLAIAVPAGEDAAPFCLDMATSAISRQRLEDAVRSGESIPPGVALDTSGNPTEDPKAALEAMQLLPLGGSAEAGSHKGYGLALAIDILSSVVSGGAFGRHLGGSGSQRSPAGIGHFFIVVRLRAFGPWVRFRNIIKDMMRELTTSKARGAPRVYYPGEAEFAIEQERRASGIPIHPVDAAALEGLARRLDILDTWEHLIEGRK